MTTHRVSRPVLPDDAPAAGLSLICCRLSTKNVVVRVKKILSGQPPALVQGFNLFLPPEHQIKPEKCVLHLFAFLSGPLRACICLKTCTPAPPPNAPNRRAWRPGRPALGPIALLLCSVFEVAAGIDSNFVIHKHNEQPIHVLAAPFQTIKPLISTMAKNARFTAAAC